MTDDWAAHAGATDGAADVVAADGHPADHGASDGGVGRLNRWGLAQTRGTAREHLVALVWFVLVAAVFLAPLFGGKSFSVVGSRQTDVYPWTAQDGPPQVPAQFDDVVTLNGCGNGTTILRGDWFGVVTSAGAQMLQVATGGTANSSGVISNLMVRSRLRGSVAAATAVVLTNPKALFVLAEPELAIPRGGSNICPPFSVDFIEVFA